MEHTGRTELGESATKSHREGRVAREIEKRTARIPSDAFLWGAGAAMIGSLALQVLGMLREPEEARSPRPAPLATFIGMWVPSVLLLGVYNKIVKVAGSDRESRGNGSGMEGSLGM